MSAFDKLRKLHQRYMEATQRDPYDPVAVQAHGMVFAGEWNARRDDLLAHPLWPQTEKGEPEEFSYAHHRYLVPKL
jgi:hypothetical protein